MNWKFWKKQEGLSGLENFSSLTFYVDAQGKVFTKATFPQGLDVVTKTQMSQSVTATILSLSYGRLLPSIEGAIRAAGDRDDANLANAILRNLQSSSQLNDDDQACISAEEIFARPQHDHE